MAVLDPRSDTVVIRVVYDGAPMAGKSTSVFALGKGLGAQVYTPVEVAGRTLYFDWLDYTGGLFEGRRIRCQIISVPGQVTLAPRRRRLLESADAVVFVGDSTPAGFDTDRWYLGSLHLVLGQLNGPAVGVVLQANKRDHPHAVPISDIRSTLEGMGANIGVVESVATDGIGIREAFVFAVRLALDRVRELMRTDQLPIAAPEVDSAQDLLAQLRKGEIGDLDAAARNGLMHRRLNEVRQTKSLASDALAEAIRESNTPEAASAPTARPAVPAAVPAPTAPTAPATNGATADTTPPLLPNERVPSGLVWPPVDGRTILHEVGQAQINLTRAADGAWSGCANNRWQIHSTADAVFGDIEDGRSVLVESARIHAASSRDKSLDHCVVLAGDGQGKYRLWQIVRIAPAP
jgi:hypothetical protein